MRFPKNCRPADIRASAQNPAHARSKAFLARPLVRGKWDCTAFPVVQAASPRQSAIAPANRTTGAGAKFQNANAARFQRAAQSRDRVEANQSTPPPPMV